MTAKLLTGSKQEIAKQVAEIEGDVREVLVFVEDRASISSPISGESEDMFAEMESYTVQVGSADFSRESIYSRMPGE